MSQFEISPELTRRMQKVGLEMVLYFDEFCKKNQLTWFFCGGCCIGTVRNKGFIPWDDDVDVFMPRKDYEKLKKLWKNSKEYSLQTPTRKRPTANQFLTICDNQTTFIKTYQKELDINHGVMLDVLPLDGCPHGYRRTLQKAWALLYSLFIVGKAPENHGKALNLAAKVLLGLIPGKNARYRIWRFCEKQMTKYDIEDCDHITELCSGPHYMQNEYPKQCFDHAVRMEFEGHELCMPSDYDTYLRMAFGDYMQLPPKEKQVCHHEYEYLDLDHCFRKYKGKYYCKE